MRAKEYPDREFILENWEYDRENGVLTNRKSKKECSPRSDGYIKLKVRINNKEHNFLAHRIIFFLENNFYPEQIDHIDGNKTNNHFSNLRAATHQQNQFNKGARGESKYKGVYRNNKKWVARICCDGRLEHIGSFEKEEEAAIAYNNKALELHGEFAHLNDIP